MSAEVFPVGEFIRDELEARDWSVNEMASRMDGDPTVNACVIQNLIDVPDTYLEPETAEQIGAAFGTSTAIWCRINETYRKVKGLL